MKTVEVIAVLKMIAVECRAGSIDKHSNLNQYTEAVEEAIALAKVVEFLDYRHSLSRTSMGFFLTDLKDGTVIIANSITELAAKLEGK